MKDKIIDLYYNWKHSMSKDNTKGTRGICILVFVVCSITVVTGIAAIIAAIIAKMWLGIPIGIATIAFGSGLFTWVSRQ